MCLTKNNPLPTTSPSGTNIAASRRQQVALQSGWCVVRTEVGGDFVGVVLKVKFLLFFVVLSIFRFR